MAGMALPRQAHRGQERLKSRVLVRRPVFWLVAATLFLAAATEIGPANWLPTFVQGLAPADGPAADRGLWAGVGLAVFGLLMATGRFAASALVTRVGVHRLLAWAAAACMLCLAAVALPWGTAFRIACLGIVGLGVACFWPTLLAMAGDRFPQAGTSMFSVLSAVGGAGCAAAPVAVGCLGSVSGNLAWGIASLAVAPALILAVNAYLRKGEHLARRVS
jgi:fucose permease